MGDAQDIFHRPVWSTLNPELLAQARVPTGYPASGNSTGLKTQLAISIGLGVTSFLIFCVLRTRWTVLFAPRSKLRRHTPPVLSSRFFAWVPELLRISEDELLDCVGLDAVMLLRFFHSSMKLFATCMIPGLLVIMPVNMYSTSEGHEPTDPDDNDGPQETMLLYLITQFTFTWVFSVLATYMIWRTYEGYIDLRRRFLLKHRNAIVNRTIMVIGLPSHLQNDRNLATFYESLGVGTVESAHVCRHVTSLKRVLEQRTRALRALELAYTEYYGNPSGRPDYDPKAIAADATPSSSADGVQDPRPGTSSAETQPLLNGNITRRPTIRLGLFGEEMDKIDHCRKIFTELDQKVQRLRMSRAFVTTNTGFVTFEDMHDAQILAQTVNTQQTLACKTFPAPEPRDVCWDNLSLPPNEMDVRTVVINVIIFFLNFFWAGPVVLLSSFLSLESLNKLFPGIRRIAGKNPLFKSLIQGFLPTVGVIIFFAVVPLILMSLSNRQGIRSHSEISRTLYNKYFTFILFNVFLVFTVAGTWAQAVNKVYHNLGELSLLLASSLPRVAPFFVNYTILRGIGMLPLQLLQIGTVFVHIFQNIISRSPRDYAEARSPPEMSYGVVYANATLLFVIILIYSCIRPGILIFGVIYFAMSYLVYKYQLLYVFFHPYESSGRIWPMVYNRLTLGLLIFQVTMLGFFMLKHAYFLGSLLVPLPVSTAWIWYRTTNTYKRTAKYVPLELLRPESAQGLDSLEHNPQNRSGRSASMSGSLNQDGYVTLDMDVSTTKSTRNGGLETRNVGTARPTKATEDPSKDPKHKRGRRNVVDEDLYRAMPDQHTDYSQPPMTLYPGVLNSGMRHYCHPAIAGALPTPWLPLKKGRPPTFDLSDDEEEHPHAPFTQSAREPDAPMDYDQGDNLAGGGQDEDEDEDNENGDECCVDDVQNDGPCSETHADNDGTRCNPEVEGISQVYYHHPERRTPNVSSGSAVGSTSGSGPSGSRP
ncbi:hypothetical protein BGX31_004812 [Mortierella sp. GBA43]|nr:hypothetical protein BGX31_004812 [Mortierella sp. GBA43]